MWGSFQPCSCSQLLKRWTGDQHHNEIRDVIGNLAIMEPVVQEANDACGIPSLIADLSIRLRGVWQPQTVALFDTRVIGAPSYSHRHVAAILSSAKKREEEKIL